MKRRVAESILLLLLISTLTLSFSIQSGRADYSWTETIYIRADGSVEPSAAPISTADNTTYVLTDNIVGTVPDYSSAIVIERDNIVVDGAGHTLQSLSSFSYSSNSIGIELQRRSNATVTIKDMKITAFIYAVYLDSSGNNTLYGNNITANYNCGVAILDSSSNNTLYGNSIAANYDTGVYIGNSTNNTLSGNNITNNPSGVFIGYSANSNTLYGNNITNNEDGIHLCCSSNSNTFSGNNITNNLEYGVWMDSSSNNTLSGNNITANTYNGVRLLRSPNNNVLSGNNITANNGGGVSIDLSSDGNTLCGNDITNNGEYGVYQASSSNNTLSGNNITNNPVGVQLASSANSNTLCENNITNNGEGVVLDSSSGNVIFHNSFINSKQVSSSNSTSVWDNGYEGNYWGDYNGTDLDGDGIGETPYIIDRINQDNYPLMNPGGRSRYWIRADVNHDLKVDVKDVYLCAKAFGSLQSDLKWNPLYDMNHDGRIDLKDLWLICRNFGKTYP